MFFLGFAGFGEEKVFAEEVALAESVVVARYGAGGRALRLVNDRRDRESRPLATVAGLRRALQRLGERMDPGRRRRLPAASALRPRHRAAAGAHRG